MGATFVETSFVGNNHIKSVAKILVSDEGFNDMEVEVYFWNDIVEQWGLEDSKKFLCAEALVRCGCVQQARDLMNTIKDGRGVKSWAKQWLEENPLPTPAVDPFAEV